MPVLLWVAGILLLSAAAAMGFVAWRMARKARVQESARVELLKALAFPDAPAASALGPSMSNWTTGDVPEHETTPPADASLPAPTLFGERGNPLTTLPRRWISLFAVGAAMALVVALYARAVGGPEAARATADPRLAAARSTVEAPITGAPPKPIELIALQYRFANGTAFDVSGLVRNPADGPELPQLLAVVELLDADGRTLTSQTTPLDRQGLEAGQTSAFALAFRHVTGTVARYKVRFRLASGDTIPQIDRRGAGPTARTPSS